MSEREKKRQRTYDLLNAKTKPKFLCLSYTKQRKNFYRKREPMICLMPKPSQSFFVYHIQSKEKIFTEKELFKEKGK